MYALFLRDCELSARIGVHAFEREAPQRLILNVSLAIRGEVGGDDIAQTTDYDFLRTAAGEILASGHLELQETVCQRMIDACRAQPDVAAALVSTEKPDVYADAVAVGCRMLWRADDTDPAELALLFSRPG
jgi:7,8-dihydroneopterin aldolase/epimerase/oxygenase